MRAVASSNPKEDHMPKMITLPDNLVPFLEHRASTLDVDPPATIDEIAAGLLWSCIGDEIPWRPDAVERLMDYRRSVWGKSLNSDVKQG